MSSKALRLRRIFGADGRVLLVAMDHAAYMGPLPGLDLPTMAHVVGAGVDAVMTTFGTARRLAQQPEVLGEAALVVSLDVDAVEPEEQVLNALGWARTRSRSWPPAASATSGARWRGTRTCASAGVCHLQAEVIPGGFEQREQHTPENIARVARQAAEMGADYVKTLYTGAAESMQRVVEGATVPVLILGGERVANDDALVLQVREALSAGVAGVAFGRNIWSHPDPGAITARLVDVVHDRSVSNGRSVATTGARA